MDRFIVTIIKHTRTHITNLKSNMDRFIDDKLVLKKEFFEHLKSNMDRFIDVPNDKYLAYLDAFKIQYG